MNGILGRVLRILPLLTLLAPGPLVAQTVRLAAFGVAATNSEVEGTRQAKGLGFGVAARAERSRFRLDVRYLHASLRADFSIQPDYDVDEVDVAATYFWRPYLAAQIGAARRFTSPAFVAQDVGLVRLGVLSETRLARIAGLWVRGAYLPVSRFSGGGNAGLGIEVGLGAELGAPEGRVQGFAEFAYQRLDREAAAAAPIQFSAGQVGVRVRL
jgi:hypothetical protein